MKFIDLIAYLSAALALGVALDFCIRGELKVAIVRLVGRLAQKNATKDRRPSALLDKFFGKRLLSPRAIFRYSLMSIFSMIASYLIALYTTIRQPDDSLTIFHGSYSPLNVSILLICVAGAVMGDVFSYAQTRLFIRAVDGIKNITVNFGLIAADGVISLTFFLVSFSLARALSYTIFVLFSTMQPLTYSSHYLASPLIGAFQGNALDKQITININSDMNATADINSASTGNKPIVNSPNEVANLSYISPLEKRGYITNQEYADCIGTANSDIVRQAYNQTSAVLKNAEAESKFAGASVSLAQIDLSIEKAKSILHNAGKMGCTEKIITKKRAIRAEELMAESGPFNVIYAAFNRTLFDLYSVVGAKFSPYVTFNPSEDISDYQTALLMVSSSNMLGIGQAPPQRIILSEIFVPTKSVDMSPNGVEKRSGIEVPFSAMAASSLTATILFMIYLLAVAAAGLRQEMITRLAGWGLAFNLERAVFTTFVVVLTGISLSGYALSALVGLLWKLLFQ